MLDRVRARLTYANLMATIAVFMALGGSSYAVSQIEGHDIKARSIDRSRVARNTLTGVEIDEQRLKLRCPKDAEFVVNSGRRLCIDRDARAATDVSSASMRCLAAGGRLTTYADVGGGLNLVRPTPGGALLADVLAPDASGVPQVLILDGTLVRTEPGTARHMYRCVYEASVAPPNR